MTVIAAMCEQGCTLGDGIAILGVALAVAVIVAGALAKF